MKWIPTRGLFPHPRTSSLAEEYQVRTKRQTANCSGGAGGFIALVLYPPGLCTGGKALVRTFPTWRYRVLRTALRLRPRRALSSASGQNFILAQNAARQNRSLSLFRVTDLTNHIPVFRGFNPAAFRLPSSPFLSFLLFNPVLLFVLFCASLWLTLQPSFV